MFPVDGKKLQAREQTPREGVQIKGSVGLGWRREVLDVIGEDGACRTEFFKRGGTSSSHCSPGAERV